MIDSLKESLSYDIKEIDSKIISEGEFIQKKTTSKNEPYENKFKFIPSIPKEYNNKNDKNEIYPKYFCKIIIPEKYTYIGILNNNLKRENYGYSFIQNDDEYLGEYKNDLKEGFGIYKYKQNNNEDLEEIYIGNYKNNKKQGEGMHITISKTIKDDSNSNKILINFKASFGFFEDDLIKEGKIYSINDNLNYFYKGKINYLGEPEDDNAFIIEDKNKIFKGKINKDNMIEGRNIFINDKYEKIKAYYFTKNKDNFYEFESEKNGENDEKLIKEAKEFEETNYEKIIQNIYNEINKGFEKMKIYENAIQVDFKNDIMYNINNNLNIII
jgi:hypothetical protein